MTRILGAAILLSAVFAIIYMARVRPEREPLLIDASAKTHAAPQMLLSPCPMTPQNIPRRYKRNIV